MKIAAHQIVSHILGLKFEWSKLRPGARVCIERSVRKDSSHSAFFENQTSAEASWTVVMSPWWLSLVLSIIFPILIQHLVDTCARCQIEFHFPKDFKNCNFIMITQLLIYLCLLLLQLKYLKNYFNWQTLDCQIVEIFWWKRGFFIFIDIFKVKCFDGFIWFLEIARIFFILSFS